MKTFDFFNPVFSTFDCVVAIGVFDGLHRGHLAIISECVSLAEQLSCEPVVVSFSVNPKMKTGRENFSKPLLLQSDFEQILDEKNVRFHSVIDFSEDMSKMTGEGFVSLLCTLYKVRAVVAGTDFRCGASVSGADSAEIEKLLLKYAPSAVLRVVPPVTENGVAVSSSLIRNYLLEGRTEKASLLLGRPYFLNLGMYSFRKLSDCCLQYEVKDFGQLLPGTGKYKIKTVGSAASSSMPGPVDCDAVAVVSEECLVLDMESDIVPDRIFFLW